MRYARHFQVQGSPQYIVNHLRWCRAHLGELGEQWDFASGRMGRKLDVWIKSDSLASWYLLKHQEVEIIT